MLNLKLIGIGAGGNKGSIDVIKDGALDKSEVFLINSTEKDIPEDYKDISYIYNSIGGCGKETSIAKSLTLSSLERGGLDKCLNDFIADDDDAVIITGALEGGTGCGSIPVIAKYCYEVLGIPVITIGLGGFEEDGRGLQNTIEFFQNMSEDYTVQTISNKKFLKRGNYNKAIEDANKELIKRIKIMKGDSMIPAEQNIDRTDLYKIVTSPGYMTMNSISISDVKDSEQFNQKLIDMVNEDKSIGLDLDTNTRKLDRTGVIINMPNISEDAIDFACTGLYEKIGEPFEKFKHIQKDENKEDNIVYIAQGMSMPIKEVEKIYKNYQEKSNLVNKDNDKFFNEIKKLKGNEEDSSFNIGVTRRRRNKNVTTDSFMEQFKKKEEPTDNSKDILTKNY